MTIIVSGVFFALAVVCGFFAVRSFKKLMKAEKLIRKWLFSSALLLTFSLKLFALSLSLATKIPESLFMLIGFSALNVAVLVRVFREKQKEIRVRQSGNDQTGGDA